MLKPFPRGARKFHIWGPKSGKLGVEVSQCGPVKNRIIPLYDGT